MEVTNLSMVEAISKAKNLVSKDEAVKVYRKWMEKTFVKSYTARGGRKPEDLEKDHVRGEKLALEHFDCVSFFIYLPNVAVGACLSEEMCHSGRSETCAVLASKIVPNLSVSGAMNLVSPFKKTSHLGIQNSAKSKCARSNEFGQSVRKTSYFGPPDLYQV